MDPLRIAVISTPRSGNTWVRTVFRDTLGLQEIAVHTPDDLPSDLPPRLILQIHWYREPRFQAYLLSHGFKLLVLARHPLDVLVSALHFVRREPLTARWLEGNVELPKDLAEHAPASSAFLSYATSWGAENLLSVSYQWWHDLSAVTARYEQLVQAPQSGFERLLQELGQPGNNLPAALAANSLASFQNSPNRHGWQGTPGLWRKLIPPLNALRIFRRHKRVFETLGYSISPYLLTRRAALQNWERLKS